MPDVQKAPRGPTPVCVSPSSLALMQSIYCEYGHSWADNATCSDSRYNKCIDNHPYVLYGSAPYHFEPDPEPDRLSEVHCPSIGFPHCDMAALASSMGATFSPPITASAEESQIYSYSQPQPSPGSPIPQTYSQISSPDFSQHQQGGYEALGPNPPSVPLQVPGPDEIEDYPSNRAEPTVSVYSIIASVFGIDAIPYLEQLLGANEPDKSRYVQRSFEPPSPAFGVSVPGPQPGVVPNDIAVQTPGSKFVNVYSQTRWVPYRGTQRKQEGSLEMPIFFTLRDGSIGIPLSKTGTHGDVLYGGKDSASLGRKKTATIRIRMHAYNLKIDHQIQVPATMEKLVKRLGRLVDNVLVDENATIPKDDLVIIGLLHVGQGSWQLILGHEQTAYT
ncbi:hypothetical protein OF83DRAFT_816522 [Amylostereum chailletii]|nr:hypothetical protein OF83DRAFT_816522 [Amylostereum chailletii]